MRHIKVYDINMNLVAILENAYKIGYVKETNNLWTCSFSLPLNDPKRFEVKPKRFIELYDHDKYIGKFIVNPKKTVKNESDNSITYNCEHVLSTFHSDVLFRYHQLTNWTTRDVLEYLFNQQEIKHWKLGVVEFTRYFHYAWENEDSLLNALISVPKPFNESYLWTWDDTQYPFTLNLVRPTDEKVDIIRYGKNLKGIEKDEDPTGLITRIYPLGYGEGVNQLGIEKVNGGVPYLQAEQSIIDEYGIHKRIWVDRRFEDAPSLKASGGGLLDKYKKPQVTVSVDCIDYELIDPYKLVRYDVSKIVGVYDEDTDTNVDLRIMKITKPDIYGDPSNIQLEIGNVRDDIGTTITDLQKKQLVNETYSQGSTNIDSHDYNDNCDPENPAVIRFYLPDDLVNINSLILTYQTEEFRAYSKATRGGGATVQSTSAGGAVVDSTSAGGGVVNSTSSGGGSTQTSSSGGGSTQTSSAGGGGSYTSEAGGGSVSTSSGGGNHRHMMFGFQTTIGDNPAGMPYRNFISAVNNGGGAVGSAIPTGDESDLWTYTASGDHSHSVSVPAHKHQVNVPSHSHSVNIPSHTHNVSIPEHSHQVSIPSHTHEISIPNHTHSITLPDHTHEILHGIYKLSEKPSKVVVKVDGNVVPVESTSAQNINLIPYLSKDDSGKIKRGQWHEITITPDKLGRVNANIISRLFIQSRTGGTF
ncbi:phage tail spike protein [Bacillus sp. DX1.1]|uniref:phage tail spike protein n=1 Tax=Bacillus sp. DX1.1 TaxID=3055866 RepID=UPI0025A310D9|nr:phage tail spike protein [Bacillus sp. DX1.1]MDM5155839.1 phage tail spike protein [Bacillus sp. DX1.1]